jgi:hypothetical protein
MKTWLVPAIICAFALSLFETRVLPVTGYESGPLPPSQEKVAKTIARLPALVVSNLVPGINFFLIYARFYHQAIQKQSSPSSPKADEAARSAAGTVTLISFVIWLVAWILVVLLKPKWWYIVAGFVLTIGVAVWISGS